VRPTDGGKTHDDPYDLRRFVDAQGGGVYDGAVAELGSGRKAGHWMWFIFPQIAGLGTTAVSQRYALSTLDEARAYLRHALLGPRLLACTHLVLESPTTTADALMGSTIDAMKLRSSMTLFMTAAPEIVAFTRVLERFYEGAADPATLARI
jgi:uncharacterized protein (DUF1810 family)